MIQVHYLCCALSVTITSAPPPTIRHQIPEAEDRWSLPHIHTDIRKSCRTQDQSLLFSKTVPTHYIPWPHSLNALHLFCQPKTPSLVNFQNMSQESSIKLNTTLTDKPSSNLQDYSVIIFCAKKTERFQLICAEKKELCY